MTLLIRHVYRLRQRDINTAAGRRRPAQQPHQMPLNGLCNEFIRFITVTRHDVKPCIYIVIARCCSGALCAAPGKTTGRVTPCDERHRKS